MVHLIYFKPGHQVSGLAISGSSDFRQQLIFAGGRRRIDLGNTNPSAHEQKIEINKLSIKIHRNMKKHYGNNISILWPENKKNLKS
jgi:hypothetical protein